MEYFENKTIVVPCDFSEPSIEAVGKVVSWGEPSTNIHLLNVLEPTPVIVSYGATVPMPPNFDNERFELAKKRLETTFEQDKYGKLHLQCRIGDPGEEVAEFAKEIKADMIVMPSHGRTGLSRFLLGSVAERVLRYSSCPVLILRGPE